MVKKFLGVKCVPLISNMSMEFCFKKSIISSLCRKPFAFQCAIHRILFGLMGLINLRGKHV
jgi:hypothetical protein